MLLGIWDDVLVGRVGDVDEGVLLLEDVLLNPECSVSLEQLCVKTISNSSSILDITDHVLHGLPGVRLVEVSALGHVLLKESE